MISMVKQVQSNHVAVKLEAREDERVQGRAYIYLIYNDLHTAPYGLLEDVFVEAEERGKGIGTALIKAAVEEARARGCYKLICTSRHNNLGVHELYKKLGFRDYGVEFRMDLA